MHLWWAPSQNSQLCLYIPHLHTRGNIRTWVDQSGYKSALLDDYVFLIRPFSYWLTGKQVHEIFVKNVQISNSLKKHSTMQEYTYSNLSSRLTHLAVLTGSQGSSMHLSTDIQSLPDQPSLQTRAPPTILHRLRKTHWSIWDGTSPSSLSHLSPGMYFVNTRKCFT